MQAVRDGKYDECFVKENTTMPMLFIEDLVQGTVKVFFLMA